MSAQKDLDALMDEMASEVNSDIDTYSERSLSRIARMRSDVYDLLEVYEKADGRISKTRVRALLRKLDVLEEDIYLELTKEIESTIEKVVTDAEDKASKALMAIIGASAAYGGYKSAEVIKEAVDFMKRKSSDGLTISERVRSRSGFLRDEIQKSVRYGINRGESITKISRRVKQTFESNLWQIKRILDTELKIVFRKTVATVGSKLGIVKAVKIIDHRGRHRYHERHECYRLAEQDMYGWGKGIYRTNDTFIFDPHPQCSAYFRYILSEKALKGVDS